MKIYTTKQGQKFNVQFAGAFNKIITVVINCKGQKKDFQTEVKDLEAYRRATKIEWGQKYFEALFEIAKNEIENSIELELNQIK